MGPVNVDAIAQFEEVKQRLDFLNGQKDDLLEAKSLLLNTINDMDDEVKSRFKATFEAIRESFKQTFTPDVWWRYSRLDFDLRQSPRGWGRNFCAATR